VTGRVVLEGLAVHVPDLQAAADEFPEGSENARRLGWRATLAVPLMRERTVIGTIGVRRTEARPFSDAQIALLQTFADQAVIAIENVRLFNDLEVRNRDLSEALDRQTATAEVLRVIGRSQTDIRPVFAAIMDCAVRLCAADLGSIFAVEGGQLVPIELWPSTPEAWAVLREVYPRPADRTSLTGRAVAEARVVHVPDIEDPDAPTVLRSVPRRLHFRSQLSVPILRGGQPIGVLSLTRRIPGPFSRPQIELVQTFADQAVIAIENARLLGELQARTAELTQSVGQLTALGEISRAVSSTLDVETVLQTIVSRATQLAGADGCAIYEYDDATEAFHIRATHNLDPVLVETLRTAPLRKGEGAMGRAAETREPTQVADIAAPGAYESHIRDTLLGAGYRALLSVPLLREGEIIGSLSLNRHTPGEFPPEAVEVLKTFATQSALAIQNARLFREIADKSRQLEAASRHKSEFLANMSHELRTPLNAIIGFSEVLAEKMFGDINTKQAEYLQDILESGRHLLSLINDILDLSKIEAGHMELEPTDFDLPSAIDNALTLVRERATRRGITVGRTVDEHLGTIRGDERKVKQVLLNLLSNALKFTPEGGGSTSEAGWTARWWRCPSRIRASASRRRIRRRSSRSSGRWAPRRGKRKAPGWAWRSPGSSSNSIAARSGCRARSAAAPPSRSRSRCGQALGPRAEQQGIEPTMRKLVTVVVGIYLAIGILLALFHPRMTDTQRLIAAQKGIVCEASLIDVIALWPYRLTYYYGGGFAECLRKLGS